MYPETRRSVWPNAYIRLATLGLKDTAARSYERSGMPYATFYLRSTALDATVSKGRPDYSHRSSNMHCVNKCLSMMLNSVWKRA